jgi:hypothetical protein
VQPEFYRTPHAEDAEDAEGAEGAEGAEDAENRGDAFIRVLHNSASTA